MPSIVFKTLLAGAIDEINGIDNADFLTVLTSQGLRQISKANAIASLGGGGGSAGGVNLWDPANTTVAIPFEPVPFQDLWYAGEGLSSLMSVPTLSTVGGLPTIVKAPQSAQGNLLSSFYLKGGFAASSVSNWMQLTVDLTSAQTIYNLAISGAYWQGPQNPNAGMAVVTISQAGVVLTAPGRTAATVNIATPTAATKIMLEFNSTFGTFTAYVDNGGVVDSEVQTVSGSFVGMLISGNIITQDEAPSSIAFNVSDAGAAIIPVDSFSGPLVLSAAPLPNGATVGRVLKAISAGTFTNRQVKASDSYYLGENDLMIPIITPQGFVTLDASNQFGPAQFVKNIALDATPFYFFYSNKGSPSYQSFANGSISGQYFANAFASLLTGSGNVGLGNVYGSMTDSSSNVGFGDAIGTQLTTGSNNNVGIGSNALTPAFSNNSVAIGANAVNITGYRIDTVVAIGAQALSNHSDPQPPGSESVVEDVVAIGYSAMTGGAIGSQTVAIGSGALNAAPTAVVSVVAIGDHAMANAAGAHDLVTAVGALALQGAFGGERNTALGARAAQALTGSDNTAVGYDALAQVTDESNSNTAVGVNAMKSVSGPISNASALGYNSTVTGNNQVQLGNSTTTVYAFGAVQDRSDPRDKTDERPTLLGLNFVLKCKPMDYRLDLRDDYIDHASRPQAPAPLREQPTPPVAKFTDENYHELHDSFASDLVSWEQEQEAHRLAMEEYRRLLDEWVAANRLGNIVHDGSKKRERFHHGFMAPQVLQAAKDCGLEDFGGFQDHAINGGQDVHSLGYTEMVAPAYRAIQELHEMLTSEAFISQIADRVVQAINNRPAED